jgi:hypothetical protein
MTPPCSKQQMQEESLAFYYMHNLFRNDSELEFLSKHHALWHCCESGSTDVADIRRVFQELINHTEFQNLCDQMISEISN